MRQVYCTLFDSNYLDKGMVLYDSMCKHIDDFHLYVFAFDDKACEILQNEEYNRMTVISLHEFENEKLLGVKKDRTGAEYCWTCTPWTIKYVLEHYKETMCTYIDADMMFFSSPEDVFKGMLDDGCSIIITPHRFATDTEIRKARNGVGEYCVEFNTFVNDDNGMKALNWWADRCLEWCYYAIPGTTQWYGDQKYLNVFPEMFEGVYICNHFGVGLAGWNVQQVEYDSEQNGKINFRVKRTGEVYPVVLYHFTNITFLTDRLLYAMSFMKNKRLHEEIYDVYIGDILTKRKYIKEKYHLLLPTVRKSVTGNILMRIYQKYVMPIRYMGQLNDFYRVK